MSFVMTDSLEPSSGRMTCPNRGFLVGASNRSVGIDSWLAHENGDRVCSFCGSLHPEDFFQLVDEALKDGSKVMIEPTAKSYKVYVHRPEVKSSYEGGMKFYGWHAGAHQTPERRAKYEEAVRKFRTIFDQEKE